MTKSRRQFLVQAGLGLAAAAAAGAARAAGTAPAASCQDPASLSLSQRSRRRAVSYVEPAPDTAKACGLCAFFTASEAGCGTCQMLGGGIVSAKGLCNSFAPRK